MDVIDDPKVQARAKATFDLYRTAKAIMRQNLRRRHPAETNEEIERRLVSWLRKETGSGSKPRHLPR
jgi:Rv0078B-related antitoxin